MKFILAVFISLNVVALPAWAHSICQYLNDENSCEANEANGCFWILEPAGSGQCVYAKDRSPFKRNLAEKTVHGSAKCRTDTQSRAEQDAMAQCQTPVTRISDWSIRTVGCYGPGHVEWDGQEFTASFSCTLNADQPERDGILRSSDGSILELTQQQAVKACPVGSRLPTARELAGIARTNGAKGILELSDIGSHIPSGYSLSTTVDSHGSHDIFYFSNENYHPPKGSLGYQAFWSSSLELGNAERAFIFSGATGDIYPFDLNYRIAVLCLRTTAP